MSNEPLRTAIWNEMVDTDRLARYYGALAGRKAELERRMTVLTTGLALVSLTVALLDTQAWVLLLSIALTAVTSAVLLVCRVGGTVRSAAYTQKALGDISIEWEALWRREGELPTAEAEETWRALARRKNELTAPHASERMDERLRDATEAEAYDYWRRRAGGSQAITTAA
ncbi:MAG: hypothetical protein OXQ94_00850 [Gemmatimonadota bacterium]|nr:hypothetical protein [Gemmatimonadota bacterium]MDE2870226.1 hypothetical protein [Gemmatimonadota bacterium]